MTPAPALRLGQHSGRLRPRLGITVWTTPALIRLLLYAIFGSALLLAVAATVGVREHRQTLQTVGRDSAPSMIAALHIRAALADMDASAADNLLLKGGSPDALRSFDGRRGEAVDALITAAENIAHGEAERTPIRRIALGLGTYSAQVQQAFNYQRAADVRSLDAYRKAADIMDSELLPAAADLGEINLHALNAAYDRQLRNSSIALSLLTLTTILIASLLVALQILLFRRTRRILNPLLILATAIVLIFSSYLGGTFRTTDRNLKLAKQGAFDSIHSLWEARALAYRANADESRYLLDPLHAGLPNSPQLEANAASVANGFLGTELRKAAFSGEREEAQRTLDRLDEYRRVALEVRRLEQHGQSEAAIALETGQGPAQYQGALHSFDDSLGKTLDSDQVAFDRAVSQGFQAIGSEFPAPIAALAVFGLSVLGVLPRLREYRTW